MEKEEEDSMKEAEREYSERQGGECGSTEAQGEENSRK